MRLTATITLSDEGKTVKYILKNRLNISGRLIKRLKFSNKILLNSQPVHLNTQVAQGDFLEAIIEFDEVNEDIIPEKMDLDIIYEDDCIIAVNKPADTVIHPTALHFTGTVANGLMYHLLEKGVKTLIRPVSRLDRNTSGIAVFALNPFIQESLVRQMKSSQYIKEYIGIVHGIVKESKGTINMPIARVPDSIMLRHVTDDGAPSVTHFEVLERFSSATLIKFLLETGRTHQIRVHCQHMGHPLIGDELYSLPVYEDNLKESINRQCLHSSRTSFTHPFTMENINLSAPIPSDMQNVLEILRK